MEEDYQYYAMFKGDELDCEEYIYPGVLYEIFSFDGETFYAPSSKEDKMRYCLVKGCAHLKGGDWTIFKEIA
mgnify:FL=1|tara:strand:+ start:487 stop:702 length:216 start_codon:yes stop_codon:yes gene_type:complete